MKTMHAITSVCVSCTGTTSGFALISFLPVTKYSGNVQVVFHMCRYAHIKNYCSLARMIHVRVQIYCAVGEVCATLFELVLCQFFHILCIHSSIAILSDVQVVCTVSERWLLYVCTHI